MIAIDTNVLVRYAVKDDFEQTVIATEWISRYRCFVLKTVLIEFVWVLSSPNGYALSRDIVIERLRHIMGLPNIVMQDMTSVALSLDWYATGMDFADALHLASTLDLKGFATFDKKIINKSEELNINHHVILLSK